jgi:hypothetical protein
MNEQNLRRIAFTLLFLALIPSIVTIPKLMVGADHPRGMSIIPPEEHDPLASKVLLIILDGLPAYVMDDPEYMPNLANWNEHGAVMEVHTSDITLTGACTKELSTGLHSAPIDAMRNWEVTYDGVDDPFHYAEAAGLDVGFTGFYVWTNLFPAEQFEHRTIYDSGFSDTYDADNRTLEVVNEWITGVGPDVMIAHLGGTDHAGHIWGINSNEYKTKMNIVDAQLDVIRRSLPDDWAMMVTADHGMTVIGGHAISTGEDAMRVFLLGTGSAFQPGSSALMTQRDISALLITLLDLPFPVSADARIPLDALNLSDESKNGLEKWNWEAAVARQQWLGQEGMRHADDISVDVIEWEKLPDNAQQVGVLDVLAALAALVGVVVLFVKSSGLKPELVRGNVIAVGIIASIWLLNYLLYTSAYEMTLLGSTARWFRKGLGVVLPALASLLILTSAFRPVRERIEWLDSSLDWLEQNTTPWFLGGLLAISLWQPDARLSPAVFSLFLALLTIKNFEGIEAKEIRLTFWGLMVFSLWSIWNYIPKVITGSSLQQWLGIEFLYKFQQQMVESFMTENTLLVILALFAALWLCSRISRPDSGQVWWLDATLLSSAAFIHANGNTMSDWFLLLVVAGCALTAFVERSRGLDLKPKKLILTLAELAVMILIIPTWGAWPAICVLLLTRLVKELFKDEVILKWSVAEHEGWTRSNQMLATALIPFLLVCIVWISFGQLTMVGLLEFNPTKWVVKGGFFGARTAPPAFWMVLITVIPIFSAVVLVLHAWLSTARTLSYFFVLLSFIIVTNMSHLWLSYSHPQVMLMMGFGSIIIISWLGAYVAAQLAHRVKGSLVSRV